MVNRTQGQKPDLSAGELGPALLRVMLRHEKRLTWVASAHSDYFGIGEVYARAASPDRALATLSRTLGGGLGFKARDVDA